MKHAYVFPGQGSQFTGMGKDLYEQSELAKNLFEQANDILGFRISDSMFEGSADDLKQTNVTQPAVFLHSVIKFLMHNPTPDMVAGHSLGEFSALVANRTLSFEDGLRLVSLRANAMQKACEMNPSTMAAVLNLADEKVVEICASIKDQVVVAANYNCPGQLVISGSIKGIEIACELMKAAGAKRALVLPVGGAFHSPLMEPARQELQQAIEETTFSEPVCAIYQNVNARAVRNADEIKLNLIAQLTAPVLWTQSVQAMRKDGAVEFTEVGPGNVLQGLVKKIDGEAVTNSL
ncbi:MAG: ACP S-malonyltransferase [Chitinophagaceae bacterium]|nr:ACP S-malonyltransferase [Chitinophagaceae bacterium]